MSRLESGSTFAKIFQNCEYVHVVIRLISITLSSVFR
jgi:hypothetical protein